MDKRTQTHEKHVHPEHAHKEPFGGPLNEEVPDEERAEGTIEAPVDETAPPHRDPLGEVEGEQEEYEAGEQPDEGAPDKPAE
jgi:hypothetical protein